MYFNKSTNNGVYRYTVIDIINSQLGTTLESFLERYENKSHIQTVEELGTPIN